MSGMVIAFPGHRSKVPAHGKRRAPPTSPKQQLKARVERIAALLEELEKIQSAEVSAILGQARSTFRKVEEKLAPRSLDHSARLPLIADESDSQPDIDHEVLERHFQSLDH